MGDGLPEKKGEVESEVTSCSEAAAHEDADEFEEAEVIGAICFGIDNPLRFVFAGLMSIVGGWDE